MEIVRILLKLSNLKFHHQIFSFAISASLIKILFACILQRIINI